jgi:hypothetical protein
LSPYWLAKLEAEAQKRGLKPLTCLGEYAGDPARYAAEYLKQAWWSKQAEIAEAMVRHRRVVVMAATGVGKTHAAAGIAQYWTDVAPGIAYTTAPSWAQVYRLLWKEIRLQRPRNALGTLAPKSADLHYAPDHFLIGVNAEKAEGLQGQHHERLLFLFDEAPGVPLWFWEVAERICIAPENRIVAIGNPFEPTGPFYDASLSENWHTITISAMDHPNIIAELQGLPAPYPGAVSLQRINEAIGEHCEVSDAHSVENFEWPPGSGQWYRPDAEFEAGVLGRFPTESTMTVIPPSWFDAATEPQATREPQGETVIGVDVARFGDDRSEFHARQGRCSLAHTALSGADTMRVAFEAKRLCELHHADKINVLVTGMGGGVADVLKAWHLPVCEINEAGKARDDEHYPNVRNEMWWVGREGFQRREYDLTRVAADTRRALRSQLCAPMYSIDSRGRRVVEQKGDTKKRVGRSPDGADAFLASHYPTVIAKKTLDKPNRYGTDYGGPGGSVY